MTMKQSSFSTHIIFLSFLIFIVELPIHVLNAQQIYTNQYAVVIGIDDYNPKYFNKLGYAKSDAVAIEKLFMELDFIVHSLYNSEATKTNILSLLEDHLAITLHKNDAVIFFFAGHGATRELGNQDWGYLIPSDANDKLATYISMTELRTLSEKMGNAKHQAFILDCCFGGQLALKNVTTVQNTLPDYLIQVGERVARQILTAGGKDQVVVDGGPGGHSVFTGYFIKGLKEKLADLNKDGWITFSELCSYLIPAASSRIQTPGYSTLPGHEQGEFLFQVDKTITLVHQKKAIHAESNIRGKHINKPISKKPLFPLRAKSAALTKTEVLTMLQAYDIFCELYEWNEDFSNPDGNCTERDFTLAQNGKVVIDPISKLMWQQSGSENYMNYDSAKNLVIEINKSQYANYSDWRLPTLEEAMSLIKKEKGTNNLFIDPLFNKTQGKIWTSDLSTENSSTAWTVNFYSASCDGATFDGYYFVRAVRTKKTR